MSKLGLDSPDNRTIIRGMESEVSPKLAWTATSLASAAGVDSSYIARLCRRGKIVAQKFGQAWMIPYEEGQRWLTEHTAESQATSKETTLTAEA